MQDDDSFRTGYLYFAATYGTTPGASDSMANKAIRERNIDAYDSVRMVDTWTPIFDLPTPEKVRKYTGTTEADIDRIICSVRERRRNRYMTPHPPAIFTERIRIKNPPSAAMEKLRQRADFYFGGELLIQEIQDGLLRLDAYGFAGDLAVFEDQKGGNAHDAVFLCEGRLGVDVHLAD